MKKEISPLLKWAGGKRQLLSKLKEVVPQNFNTYFEPFLGGGALLFDLQPEKAVVADINPQLINLYIQVKNHPQELIEEIGELNFRLCDAERYYLLREKYNAKIQMNILDIESVALFLWLNKYCFNGLYRVNSEGKFNVPWNKECSKKVLNEYNLIKMSDYLNHADIEILCEDFSSSCIKAKAGDFIYFDPPYAPLPKNRNETFTKYSSDGFSVENQEKLAKLASDFAEKGVFVVLSNHDSSFVRDLYSAFTIREVEARRAINRDGKGRKEEELIIFADK